MCVVCGAEQMNRNVRLVTEDPTVVSRRNIEKIARTKFDLRAIVHRNHDSPRHHHSDLFDLAAFGSNDRRDMLGPLPARLLACSA